MERLKNEGRGDMNIDELLLTRQNQRTERLFLTYLHDQGRLTFILKKDGGGTQVRHCDTRNSN